MRKLLVIALALCLAGCGASSAFIKSEAVSNDDAIEDVTNKLLLLNILRARDKAPLHFSEIPRITESLQENASLSTLMLFGPFNKSVQRDTSTLGLSLQVAPSFEIDHVDTKEFVTGMASPIDPRFIKFWLDRGIDRRVVLLLFFSAADIVQTDAQGHTSAIRVRNAPREALDSLAQQSSYDPRLVGAEGRCDIQSEFQHYLNLINSLTGFSAHTFTERRLLVDDLKVDTQGGFLKDIAAIAALDPTRFQWYKLAEGHYRIYSIAPDSRVALCFSNTAIRAGTGPAARNSACVQSVVDATDDDDSAEHRLVAPPLSAPPFGGPGRISDYCSQFNRFHQSLAAGDGSARSLPGVELRLEIRSVGEIIQFLGDLLAYQEGLAAFHHTHPQALLQLNDPVTFGFCRSKEAELADPGCADLFFDLRDSACNARFSLRYRDRTLSVPRFDPPDAASLDGPACTAAGAPVPAVRDHTLEVLAVVHHLVDLQRSAKDIRETPFVQVLP